MRYYRLNSLIYNKYINILFQESRGYAGHSKWQNIKHTKQAIDTAKSLLFRTMINKMRYIVAETGNSNPNQNPKLSQIIEQAKKANMPIQTINKFLEKAKKQKTVVNVVAIRGPGGCTLILYVTSDNLVVAKSIIASILKKHNARFAEPSIIKIFDCACYIIASKECNLDQAMEDAISVNLTDVEETENDGMPCFQFKGEFLSSEKYIPQLKSVGYSIISIEDTCIPECIVELNEADLMAVNKLKDKLLTLSDIEKIEDNIAEP